MKNLNRMEMPDKRISEIEDKQTEIIQYEQQRKKRLEKKLNKASGTCETLTKVLRFMLLESQKERSKSGAEKYLKKIMSENNLNLVEHTNLLVQEVH